MSFHIDNSYIHVDYKSCHTFSANVGDPGESSLAHVAIKYTVCSNLLAVKYYETLKSTRHKKRKHFYTEMLTSVSSITCKGFNPVFG